MALDPGGELLNRYTVKSCIGVSEPPSFLAGGCSSGPHFSGARTCPDPQIFGEGNFRNEIVWKYREAFASQPTAVGRQHDVILHYCKSQGATDNLVLRPLKKEERQKVFKGIDTRGPFTLSSLTALVPRPNLRFEWHGKTPPSGTSWRYTLEKLGKLEADDRVYFSEEGATPRLKVFLSEDKGVDVGSIWTDIPRLSPASNENTKYHGQKPLGLMERLVCKGSNAGDTILDPFCGSGTTVIAAERHDRRWIASDMSQFAIELTAQRLSREFGARLPGWFQLGNSEGLEHHVVKAQHFKRLAISIDGLASEGHLQFVLDHEVPIEETRHYEFKEVKSIVGAVDSIVNTADEYAVVFLNSEGGRLYWGVRDADRIVVGVQLTYRERDRLRRDISAKLSQIQPSIDPSQYRVELHQVRDEGGMDVHDKYVVEMVVPAPNSREPYYTGGGDAWVKVDGVKQKLRGVALTDFIRRRLEEQRG